jgi:hypothetical protein
MVLLKTLLLENENVDGISIEDVQKLVSSSMVDRDAKITLGILDDWYFDEKPERQQYAKEYISLLNRVFQHVVKLAQGLKAPHVNVKYIKSFLLEQREFKFKEEEFFPFPLYIAATPDEYGDFYEIGIMIDQNGKVLEIHEGNDEATPETINMVNKLVNPSGKKVRVYGMHGTKVVQQIEMTGYLPANLYVSSDRGHAASHWDNTDRSLFTGIVDINDLSQESDLDWKTIGPTKIEKFRWV